MKLKKEYSEIRDTLIGVVILICIMLAIGLLLRACKACSLKNNGIQAAGVVLDNDFTPSDKYLIEYTYDNKKGRMVAKSAIEDSKIQVGDSAMIIFDSEDDTNNKVLYFFETKIDTVSESRIIVSRKPIDELRHPLGPLN